MSFKNLFLFNTNALEVYNKWETPTVIISDGPYGVGGFPGDPLTPDTLSEWYKPHISEWTSRSTPQTTLWFWNTEPGWANVHKEIINHGWDFVNCHIWDKGVEHIAGNVNSKTIRHFPIVTEVCAQYVKRALFKIEDRQLSMQEWLRYEWLRSGLPFSKTNEVCGVKNAATRKYFTACHLWYYPPADAFEKIVEYANKFGKEKGKPYFSVDGKQPVSKTEWEKMRAVFHCDFGISNVWREPPLNGKERLRNGTKSLHLNQKPLKFMCRIIKSSSNELDVVWEPFGGLFTGMLATRKLNRIGYAAEISKTIFDYGYSRLKNVLAVRELEFPLEV